MELLHLNNVSTGCILLGGLFVYDIFWVRWGSPLSGSGSLSRRHVQQPSGFSPQVFGTNVMVTVAKSFEAPIKRKHAGSIRLCVFGCVAAGGGAAAQVSAG